MTITRILAIVVALDVAGLIVTLATGAEGLGHAQVIGTPINAPFTFVAVQALLVFAALRHRAGAAVLFLLCVISVASGAEDGSYAADLSAGERALQLSLVAATVGLGAAAARAALRPRPRAVAVGQLPGVPLLASLRRSVAASPRRTDAVRHRSVRGS